METFYSTLEAVTTLFAIGIIGFSLISKRVLPETALAALSPLLLEVSLPALSFVKILTKFNLSQIDKVLIYPLAWIVFTLSIFIFTHLFKFFSKAQFRGEFAMTLFFQNAVFVPLILISRIYGKDSEHLVNLFLFTLLYAPFFFNFNHIFFDKKGAPVNWQKVFHPIVLGTILAIILVISGTASYVPNFLVSAFSMVGTMAIPVLMIMVGGNIYLDFKNSKKFNYIEVVKFVIVKNFIFPALSIFILFFIKLDYELSLIIFLQAAVPPLMAVPIFAMRMNKNVAITNQYILGSLAFSIISIPVMFWIFNLYIMA